MVLPISSVTASISIAKACHLRACRPSRRPGCGHGRGLLVNRQPAACKAFVLAIGNGAARGGPREQPLLDLDTLHLGLVFGLAHACHFGVDYACNVGAKDVLID